MRTILEIGLAGSLGALARYGLEGVVNRRSSAVSKVSAPTLVCTSRILRLSEDLPVVIEIVDTAEKIDRAVPILDEMVGEGMVTLGDVRVIDYRGSRPNP